ncbi:MAG TPA: tetratricopeptide repeat protein [Candidatus Angelobacter sp.]|nr:tetratricopeptide repeat protein [Candidatus Angelobacter sp.]
MRIRSLSLPFLLLMALVTATAQSKPTASHADAKEAKDKDQRFPVTTSSRAAAHYFETGMVHYENHRWNFALRDWREALELDPKFALAYTWICFTTTDPAEESKDRTAAKALIDSVTPVEQLMIRWMAGVHENNYVQGIQAMNDLAQMFPHDKRLNFLIGYWLYKLDEYERSKTFTLRALAEDDRYATAYNQLGYLYSRERQYDKAIEAMEKYVKLLPDQPNPHDSYGEMLRLSGRFDDALAQYHTALKIDPTFYISQKELGETYAIMGQEERAREEYAKAVHEAPGNGIKAEYMQKAAMTWLREQKFDEADKAYREAAENAHAMGQWVWEARAHRIMAMYQHDHALAEAELDRAEAILVERRDAVAKADLDEERARILRVRVEHAVARNDLIRAQKLLADLETMANSGSISIQRTYSGAAGTLLLARKKYRDAAAQLEQDFVNPMSMKLLVTAYQKSGAKAPAEEWRKRLLDWKIPTVEEALVVPAYKAQQAAIAAKK